MSQKPQGRYQCQEANTSHPTASHRIKGVEAEVEHKSSSEKTDSWYCNPRGLHEFIHVRKVGINGSKAHLRGLGLRYTACLYEKGRDGRWVRRKLKKREVVIIHALGQDYLAYLTLVHLSINLALAGDSL